MSTQLPLHSVSPVEQPHLPWAQTRLQVSLGNLAGITTREMTRLLDDRLDSLGYRTLETLAAGIAAVLLALAAIILPLTGRRRGAAGPSPSPRIPGESTRDMTVGPGGVELGGQMPAYGEATSTRRERTGALR